ncbi:CaiB/BaiF CoA transferase family protein [Actinophytocola sp.]|uniref:CaiB/BaiF CoA transferase family protein n=1 Tax=Actinophytocola sp. TaxID=1872138 RepID=UPI003D6A0E45
MPGPPSDVPAAAGPLAGVTVLELGHALAGPFCAMLLGDLGADVIKVEPPTGDMLRHSGPFDGPESLYFTALNRNKRSVVVDLKSPEARRVAEQLLIRADVVIANFRAGVGARLHVSYEDAARVNPAVIYLSISGYGSTGPNARWGGFDQVAQGASGLMSVTGTTGYTRVGVPIGDVLAATYGTVGVLGALHRRSSTGRGEHVETSLLSALVSSLGVLAETYLSRGEVPSPAGNDHPVLWPYGVFEAQDGMINVAVAHNGLWRQLCEVLHREDLGRAERFATNELRVRHRDEIRELLNGEFGKHTRDWWTARLNAHGIPAGPVNTLAEVFADPQVLAQDLVAEVTGAGGRPRRTLGSPLRFSAGSRPVRSAAPDLGADTDEVLAQVGFAKPVIEDLRRSGVVGRTASAEGVAWA